LSVISCFGALLTVTAAGLGRAPGRLSASAEQAGAPRPAPRAPRPAPGRGQRRSDLGSSVYTIAWDFSFPPGILSVGAAVRGSRYVGHLKDKLWEHSLS
jgi:hypothetical protein